MNTAPQTPLDEAVKRLEDTITVITPLDRPLALYPQNKDILTRDLRTVLDALAPKAKRIADLESALNEIKAIAAQDFNSGQLLQANRALEAIHDIADAVVSRPLA